MSAFDPRRTSRPASDDPGLARKANSSRFSGSRRGKAVRRYGRLWLIMRRFEFGALEQLAELGDFGRDVLAEFFDRVFEKCGVLGLRLGNTNFDMGDAVAILRERIGHQDLGSVRHWQQRRER